VTNSPITSTGDLTFSLDDYTGLVNGKIVLETNPVINYPAFSGGFEIIFGGTADFVNIPIYYGNKGDTDYSFQRDGNGFSLKGFSSGVIRLQDGGDFISIAGGGSQSVTMYKETFIEDDLNAENLKIGTTNITTISSGAASDWTLTLPPNGGVSNNVLSTDGVGNTQWSSIVSLASTTGTGSTFVLDTNPTISSPSFTGVSTSDDRFEITSTGDTLRLYRTGGGDIVYFGTSLGGNTTAKLQFFGLTNDTSNYVQLGYFGGIGGTRFYANADIELDRLSGTGGVLKLPSSSNFTSITTQANTDWTLTLPQNGGVSGYVLSTDGSGVTSWVAQTGGGAGSGTVTSVGYAVDTNYLTLSGTASPITTNGSFTVGLNSPSGTGTIVLTNDATLTNPTLTAPSITTPTITTPTINGDTQMNGDLNVTNDVEISGNLLMTDPATQIGGIATHVYGATLNCAGNGFITLLEGLLYIQTPLTGLGIALPNIGISCPHPTLGAITSTVGFQAGLLAPPSAGGFSTVGPVICGIATASVSVATPLVVTAAITPTAGVLAITASTVTSGIISALADLSSPILNLVGPTLEATGIESGVIDPSGLSNYTLTLPPDVGSNLTVMQNDGAGVLTWIGSTGTGKLVRESSPILTEPSIKNGITKVTLKAPIGFDTIFTFPPSNGTSGQILTANGSGLTSWTDTAAGVTSVGLTASTQFVVTGSPITSSGTFDINLQSPTGNGFFVLQNSPQINQPTINQALITNSTLDNPIIRTTTFTTTIKTLGATFFTLPPLTGVLNQVLTKTVAGTEWQDPAATGVTSVGFSVPAGQFTISSSTTNPITSTGTFELDLFNPTGNGVIVLDINPTIGTLLMDGNPQVLAGGNLTMNSSPIYVGGDTGSGIGYNAIIDGLDAFGFNGGQLKITNPITKVIAEWNLNALKLETGINLAMSTTSVLQLRGDPFHGLKWISTPLDGAQLWGFAGGLLGIGSDGATEIARWTGAGIRLADSRDLILTEGVNTTTITCGATSDWVLKLPVNPGSSGQILTTNGAGVTSWETPVGGGSTTGTGAVVLKVGAEIESPDFFGTVQFFGTTFFQDTPIYLRSSGDVNHGLEYNVGINGPRLFGFEGGRLDYAESGGGTSMVWSSLGVVIPDDKDLILTEGGFITAITCGATSNWILRLPVDAGTSGQVLTTNGSGVTSWVTPAGGGSTTGTGAVVLQVSPTITNPTLDNSTLYLRNDTNHGLEYNVGIDGPRLFGFSGGRLDYTNSGGGTSMVWNSSGVTLPDDKDLILTEGGFLTTITCGATSSWTMKLPTDAGNDEQFLMTNGSGVTSWKHSGPNAGVFHMAFDRTVTAGNSTFLFNWSEDIFEGTTRLQIDGSSFRNVTGRTIVATFSWSTNGDVTGGAAETWLLWSSNTGGRYGAQSGNGSDKLCGTATVVLQDQGYVEIWVKNASAFSTLNFQGGAAGADKTTTLSYFYH